MRKTVVTLLVLTISLLVTYGCSWPFQYDSLRVGRDPTWYPLELHGRERNILAFSDELFQSIANDLGLSVEFIDTNWSSSVEGLHQGKFDALLTPLMPNPRNSTVYEFSELYFHTGPVLIVLEESPIGSLDDLFDQELSVQRGVSFSATVQLFPSLNITPYENYIVAIEELIAGKSEGVVLESVQAHAITQGLYKNRVRMIPPPLTKEGLRLVELKNGKHGLVELFNHRLKELKSSGKLNELAKKWNLGTQS
ncbi:MAG: amino acid ABC transporter substrate-binding protein [Waddliaceae bacterium]|nr:amino acid ABC transporter substrate-binding protein [Waddliaceae bacterium]